MKLFWLLSKGETTNNMEKIRLAQLDYESICNELDRTIFELKKTIDSLVLDSSNEVIWYRVVIWKESEFRRLEELKNNLENLKLKNKTTI